MSIIGIGIDIVKISRFKEIIKKFGKKFAKKILSNNEWHDFLKTDNDINFLAKRFAVKEATVKSIGTGFRNKIFFKNIELQHNIFGKPKIKFLNKKKTIINKLHIKSIHITISDEKNYIIAFVILEK